MLQPTVFIKATDGNLTDCVQECFDAFRGVESVIKESGKVFLKINLTELHIPYFPFQRGFFFSKRANAPVKKSLV